MSTHIGPEELQDKITLNLKAVTIKVKEMSVGKKKPLAIFQRYLGTKKVSYEIRDDIVSYGT